MEKTKTIDPSELLSQLEEGLASPAASALRTYVMRKDRKAAIEIIKDECDFTDAECKALYKHLSKMLQGKDVCFVEVPKKEWLKLEKSIPEYEDIADLHQQESFLVRYRCEIFSTQPFKNGGKTVVYVQGRERVPFDKLDQIWRIVNK